MRQILFSVIILLALLLMVAYASPQPDLEIMPEFARIQNPKERKRVFFDFMRPIVEAENDRISDQRRRMLRLKEKQEKDAGFFYWESSWLNDLCVEYRVTCADLTSEEGWQVLEMRIGQVPVNLALAQSAAETAWGTSRFAVLGNAMFGQWTFSKTSGMLPQERPAKAKFRVAEFDSVQHSVRSYIRNLNTHSAYKNYRWLRHQIRKQGIQPDGLILADGLVKYSQRRYAYVNELKKIIHKNRPLMRIQ